MTRLVLRDITKGTMVSRYQKQYAILQDGKPIGTFQWHFGKRRWWAKLDSGFETSSTNRDVVLRRVRESVTQGQLF